MRSIMPPSKKGPSTEPGPSEREGDDDDGESTASRRRYHDALSTGVGMDARVHGTSTRTAPPGFQSQRGSARGPTPPSSQVGGSSPPRMFAAPGQPVGSSFNLDNVNLGGAHRSQTQTTASASNPKSTRSSFERPASLQGRSSAASDRWKAAGRATGVPDNAQEPGTKKRSGFMLAYKAVKRSMGIPSKKEKAANEKDAAKPRGAAAFASVLPPRTAPAGGASASNAKNDPRSTPGAKRSAKDLWATAGAASGVTDEAIASASKKKSPLLMAYKKMKRSMGIPSKKERAEREARANFPATPKTLPELASMDPMGGDSPGGDTGSGGETRYQSALAQIIGQPVTTNTQQRPTETRTASQAPATRHLPSRTMSMAEHSPQRMVGRAWDPELVDRILGGDVEGAIVSSGQTRARHGHGRSDSNANVEALLAMADEISVEVSDAGALSARERWALAGRGTGASDAAARVRDASTGDAFYKTVESASVRRKFADAMRETIGDMRRRHESTVAIAAGMSALIEELEDVEPAAVAFGRLQLRTGFVGESYRPASRREPYVVARAPDLEANRQSQNWQSQSQRSSMSLGPGVHPPTPLDIGVLPDPPGMDEHWHMSPAKAEMESSSAAVDAAVNAALSLFPPSPEKSIDSIEPSLLNTSIDDAPLLPIPAEIEEEMETRARTRTRTQTRPRTPPPRHRFTDEERRRISTTAKGRENLPPGIKNRLDAMTRRTAAEVKAAAIVDEDDELSDDVRNDRARNNTVGHASDTSSGSDEVNVGGWLDRPERFARGRDLKTSNSRPTSAVGGLSASQSPAAIAAMRARNAAAAARRRLPGLATRGSNRAVGLEAKFREAASDSDGFDSRSDVESDGDGSSSSSPVAALRARGLAPKASSDLESLRALRRKLAESSNKNKNGVGAAKVLGDLARLGGYNSWDQVPTKRDPHGRNDGDLDALLMSPASEADVIRARDALDATPKSVSEARLRAAYAVDVQRRRVRMSSPKHDVDRDGSVPVSPYAYGTSPDGSPAHRSLAQRRAAYREARARAIQEAGLDGS